MKRRYDVPLGRKVWVVEEDRTTNWEFIPCIDARGNTWTYMPSICPVKKRFPTYHQAAAYFVKQKLLSTHEVQLREETVQDFSVWRKR